MFKRGSEWKKKKSPIKPQNIRSVSYRMGVCIRIRDYQINAFVYFVRQKVYPYDKRFTIKPQNIRSIFGRLYSHTWLPNKRFCVLRTTKGLFVRQKVYPYDKRFFNLAILPKMKGVVNFYSYFCNSLNFSRAIRNVPDVFKLKSIETNYPLNRIFFILTNTLFSWN